MPPMDTATFLTLLLGVAAGLGIGVAVGRSRADREHARSRAELTAQFAAVSQQALDRTSQQLAAHTEARLDQAQQLQAALVAPLSESLTRVQQQVEQVEADRVRAYSGLLAQVEHMQTTSEQLRLETKQLVTALRNPQTRGRWGELQLRRTVEAAGLVEHVDFDEQVSVNTADGVQRPDLVVHLAGGKHVVVDAKVAFNGYLEAIEARDETTRAERLKAHARHLRNHIDELAAKRYWSQFDSTPEFVVLFVPAETFLNAALEQDPTLLERGFARNVVIATPSTLVALLRTVAYAWRQEALADNAEEVFRLGKELHGRLATMGSNIAKLGSALGRSVDAYNETVGSLESRVLVTARKLADLHAADSELEAPEPIGAVPRALQKAELLASVDEALVTLPEPDTRASALGSTSP